MDKRKGLWPNAIWTRNGEHVQKEKEIKNKLRENCSPRHVPYKIIQVNDIPYTLNGKKVEIAIKKIINGEKILNKESIINPEALIFFKNLSI